MSPGAPYHHFADQHALLLAVAVEGFAQLGITLGEPTHLGKTPEARLHAMSAAYVRSALAHAAHYRIVSDPSLGQGDDVEPVAASARATFQGLVRAIAEVADLPAAVARHRAVAAWSAAHGAVHLALGGMVAELVPALGSSEELARNVTDAVVAIARRHRR